MVSLLPLTRGLKPTESYRTLRSLHIELTQLLHAEECSDDFVSLRHH